MMFVLAQTTQPASLPIDSVTGLIIAITGLLTVMLAIWSKVESARANRKADTTAARVETATAANQNSINNIAATARQALSQAPPTSAQVVVVPTSSLSPTSPPPVTEPPGGPS